MSEMNAYGELAALFLEHYRAQRYQEALELVTQAHIPGYEGILIIYRVAMLALLNDTTKAIELLNDALTQGYWYHEKALKNDPDFANLQLIPEFKELVEKNAELRRRDQTQTQQQPPLLKVLQPDVSTPSYPLLLVLHGNLSNVGTFIEYWQPAVQAGYLVALPQSSQLSWLSGFYDWNDLEQANQEIMGHLKTLTSEYRVNPDQAVVAGFSMGGVLAQRLALGGSIKVKGICLIEGWSLEPDNLVYDSGVNPQLRAYLIGGDSFQDIDTVAEALSAKQISCKVEKTSNPYHGLAPNFSESLARFLEFMG